MIHRGWLGRTKNMWLHGTLLLSVVPLERYGHYTSSNSTQLGLYTEQSVPRYFCNYLFRSKSFNNNQDPSNHFVFPATLQELALTIDRPIIDLETKNPKLFIYVQNLSLVKKLRTNLNDMRRYLTECRLASTAKLLDGMIGTRRHLVQCINMYSVADLIGIENGSIIDFLNKTFAAFEQHIRKCELCTGKGYLCEICSNEEVLFPFDDGAVHCKQCKTVFHRACWLRKNQRCPKCARMELRKSLLLQSEEDEANANK